MTMPTYKVYNGAAPTIASQVAVATGTAIKTLLQIATPATRQIQIIEWGISFDGSAAATPGIVELIQTDVAATSLTAHVAAGVQPQDPNSPASLMTLGTSATGYTAGAEGTITATRSLDVQLIAPTNQYIYQWLPDQRPIVPISKFLRVRVKFGTTVNAITWVTFLE
jgi:hypothetical protein